MLEIIGETIFYVVLNFIGGSVRWIFGTIWQTIFNTPKHSYKEYIYGPDKPNHYDSAHGCINIVIAIGLIIVLVVIFT
ncbi:hypothetical protein [Winogradskyella sp. R77965]|uniref:hypothetical protein n=1 Tax=Winogradskyella sp. R77965 TaxID=3093872 RepID=UPI0037DC892D